MLLQIVKLHKTEFVTLVKNAQQALSLKLQRVKVVQLLKIESAQLAEFATPPHTERLYALEQQIHNVVLAHNVSMG